MSATTTKKARLLVRKVIDKEASETEIQQLLSWVPTELENAPACRDMGAGHLEELLEISATQALNLIRAATP